MKYLITGKNGQLGSALSKILRERKEDFSAVDIEDCDLSVRDAAEDFFGELDLPRFIINCAAYTDVEKAEEEPGRAYSVNSEAVKNLVEISRGTKAKLIHISTDYVFDGNIPEGTCYDEYDKPDPLNEYGKSKLEGEKHILGLGENGLVVRTSWLYGRGGALSFIEKISERLLSGDKVNVVNDQTGALTCADDLANAVLSVGEDFSGILHYTNSGDVSWYDIAVFVSEILGAKAGSVIPVITESLGSKAKRPKRSRLCINRISDIDPDLIKPWKDSLIKFIECHILNRTAEEK
ncbi:MAG: dTDP-4-dehydrorhamnose reductase [Fibrobacterota bacterium]